MASEPKPRGQLPIRWFFRDRLNQSQSRVSPKALPTQAESVIS